MKNPFLSLYLSQANRVAGYARAHATAAVKRETAKQATQMTNVWTDAMFPLSATSRKKTTRRKK